MLYHYCKTRKPEIFKDYYWAARKKPINREKTKPKTPVVIRHVRYVNILTWLPGFHDTVLCLVVFSSLLGIEIQRKL